MSLTQKLLRHTRGLRRAVASRLWCDVSGPAPAISPLEAYPGYSETDLKLIDKYFSRTPVPESGFITDRLGVRTRGTSLWDIAQQFVGTVLPPPVPADYHAETVEWIGLLKSVESADGRFAMAELGAGWGPWLVAGAAAARQRRITDLRLLAVEGDPMHFSALRQHFLDNGLDPDSHTLLQAAVGPASGSVRWPRVADARNDWGTHPLDPNEREDTVSVQALAVAEVLTRERVWDLVHIDVQGGEVELLAGAPAEFDSLVRWLVIGTHSRLIESQLLAMLPERGWTLTNEKPCRFIFDLDAQAALRMTTHDGTQVWQNRRLA